MTRIPPDQIADWLEAERRGDPDAADRGLLRAMRGLERLAPPPGFARRVVAASGLVRRRSAVFVSGWVRAATAAAMVLAGLGLLGLPVTRLLVEAPAASARAVPAAVEVSLRAADVARAMFAILALVLRVGEAVGLAATTPFALSMLAGSLALAALSLAGLRRLLAPAMRFS